MTASTIRTRRKHKRRPLQIDLSKHLFLQKDQSPVRCLGVDVSKGGLGVVGFEALTPGVLMVLQINERSIALEVVWSKIDPIRKGIRHAGIKVCDPKDNLVFELESAGLIDMKDLFQGSEP